MVEGGTGVGDFLRSGVPSLQKAVRPPDFALVAQRLAQRQAGVVSQGDVSDCLHVLNCMGDPCGIASSDRSGDEVSGDFLITCSEKLTSGELRDIVSPCGDAVDILENKQCSGDGGLRSWGSLPMISAARLQLMSRPPGRSRRTIRPDFGSAQNTYDPSGSAAAPLRVRLEGRSQSGSSAGCTASAAALDNCRVGLGRNSPVAAQPLAAW